MRKLLTQQEKVEILRKLRANMDKCRCIVGFDAFIDHITKYIRERDAETVTYFETLKEYAEFMINKGEMSGSIEMIELSKKLGGNNPILSYGLGKTGAKVISIGAYGEDKIHPIFTDIQKYCSLYTFTAPGECWSTEFTNNKIMNYINMDGEDFTYQKITESIGENTFIDMVEQAGLIVLVNYSEQTKVLDIWKGLLEKALIRAAAPRKFFFDLSDCTKLTDTSIYECLDTISKFRNYGKVFLSLNENEFSKLCALYISFEVNCKTNKDVLNEYLIKLKQCISVDYIILRTLTVFYAVGDSDVEAVPNLIEENPLYLTGAGDNQNAGICMGLMSELSISDSLVLGVLYGNYYIRNGTGGKLEEILGI